MNLQPTFKGSLRRSKFIVRRVYSQSTTETFPECDKISKMCQGVWSRLRFAYLNRNRHEG